MSVATELPVMTPAEQLAMVDAELDRLAPMLRSARERGDLLRVSAYQGRTDRLLDARNRIGAS